MTPGRRAKRLCDAERARIAAMGGRARRLSREASQRIGANFQYLAAVHALHPPPMVRRSRVARGRLPGIYPDR
jgi:hypothetical protein